jgi:hypothetical protein
MWTSRMKSIHLAVGAAFISSMFAVSAANARDQWVQEQLGLSDGAPQPAAYGHEARGPEGRSAVASESKRDSFLEQELSLTDGGSDSAEGTRPRGPEGRPADSIGGRTNPFLEHERQLSDGGIQ